MLSSLACRRAAVKSLFACWLSASAMMEKSRRMLLLV